MSNEQGSNTAMVPMSELGSLSVDQYADYCADLWERVERKEISVDEAATLMFGDEPTITYTRFTA